MKAVRSLSRSMHRMDSEDVEMEEALLRHDPVRLHRTKLDVWSRGFLTGSSATMFVISMVVMVTAYDPRSGAIQELAQWSYPYFRTSFFLSFTALCFGSCTFVWRRLQVDVETIFGADIRYQWVLSLAQTTMLVTFAAFCVYVDALIFTAAPQEKHWFFFAKHWFVAVARAMPLVAFFAPLVAWWLWPRTQPKKARYALFVEVVGPIFLTPWRTPTFAQTFVADVFCSMPKVFSDFAYVTFHLVRMENLSTLRAMQTVLDGLPFFLRFVQSVSLFFWGGGCGRRKQRGGTTRQKHAWNAGKYAMALALVATSVLKKREKMLLHHHHHLGKEEEDDDENTGKRRRPYATAWLVLSVVCTVYNFTWDIVCDWGLLTLREIGFFKERPPCLPAAAQWYYFPRWLFLAAVCLDGVFRLGWAVYVSPHQDIVEQHVILLLGSVEIARRFVWAIFRVVHEQINLDLHADDPLSPEGHHHHHLNDDRRDERSRLAPSPFSPSR
mmetsp:Transcript_7984/g.26229  ORF Transcript_7984/g.26229 Transcript_7984/m.26229 type:complete len:496 (+) Transcript_7984:251-1738(+)